jgi:polysaccharide deacetylase 2 family uncharacterized protein YibQ
MNFLATLKGRSRFVFILLLSISSLISIFTALYFLGQAKKELATRSAAEKHTAIIEIESSNVLIGQLKPKLSKMEGNGKIKQLNLIWRVRKIGEDEKHKSRISFVITNLGLSKEYTRQALTLDNSFTLGFSPYANDIHDWIEQSVSKGFETLIHLPMQQNDYPTNDPGRLALLNNLSVGENLARLDSLLHRSEKVIGFYSDEGEVFSNDNANFVPILEELNKFQLIYLNANSNNADWLDKAAKGLGLELETADMTLSNELSLEQLDAKLDELLAIASKKGRAVAILRSYPYLMEHVDSWINQIDHSKYAVVPISNQFLWENKLTSKKQEEEEHKDNVAGPLPVQEIINEVEESENVPLEKLSEAAEPAATNDAEKTEETEHKDEEESAPEQKTSADDVKKERA